MKNRDCRICQFYNKKENKCKVTGDKDCYKKLNYEKCNNFIINDKLVNYQSGKEW